MLYCLFVVIGYVVFVIARSVPFSLCVCFGAAVLHVQSVLLRCLLLFGWLGGFGIALAMLCIPILNLWFCYFA